MQGRSGAEPQPRCRVEQEDEWLPRGYYPSRGTFVLYGIVKMASRKMEPPESAVAHSAFLITMETLLVTESCLSIRKLAVRASKIEHGISASAKWSDCASIKSCREAVDDHFFHARMLRLAAVTYDKHGGV